MKECKTCLSCVTQLAEKVNEFENGENPSIKLDCASCKIELEEEEIKFTIEDWKNFHTASLGW